MKRYATDKIRNVVLLGHGGCGKTSLSEALLYLAGVTDRLGRADAGTTVSDSSPDEIERQCSISAALLPFEWKECKINLLDAPGYADFIGEAAAAMRAADGALLVLDATAGVEVQTERLWEIARQRKMPVLLIVNRLDKEHSDFARAVEGASQALGAKVVPVAVPIGSQQEFRGVVDLLGQRALVHSDGKVSQQPVPAEVEQAVARARERVIEAAAEADDALTEKYLEQGGLSDEETARGLRQAVLSGSVVPAVPAAAIAASEAIVGVDLIADCIVTVLPSPADRPPVVGTDPKTQKEETRKPSPEEPMCALVFKTLADPFAGRLTMFRCLSGTVHSDSNALNTTRNSKERVGQIFVPRGKGQEAVPMLGAGDIGVVAKLRDTLTGDTLCDEQKPIVLAGIEFPEPTLFFAIYPRSKGDEDKVSSGLHRLMEEDPTLRVSIEPQTHETLLAGMGDLHLEVTASRLKRKFNVEVETRAPRVPYRETIRAAAKARGRHKKQTGGRGQFGDVWVEIEPLEHGAGLEFVDKIVGGAVPRNYIASVEKGIREAAERGVLAGYPLSDFRARLYDGSYHSVDSSDLAFKIAGSLALQNAVPEARPVLLEPIMEVEVNVPDAYMGDVIGGLNSKRGRVLGVEPSGNSQKVRCHVPQSEIFGYATQLRSMTGGRGSYSMGFSHYEEVPDHAAQAIIEAAKAARER
jgi:elongation factor G